MAAAPGTDSYRPGYGAKLGPPPAPSNVQRAMYEFQGHQRQGRLGPPQGGEFSFRQQHRPSIADRPLLAGMRNPSPDPMPRAANTTAKYRWVDDLTDSSEEDVETSHADDDADQPAGKRQRVAPSWSNPDPYTTLPPVADSQRKKQNVVKLIRRARVTPPAAAPASNVAVHGEDFISLDMGDDGSHNFHEQRPAPPGNAPTGPRSQPSEGSAQLGKRKRDQSEGGPKLPPKSKKGGRLHENGRIVREWQASDIHFSTPWYQPRSTLDTLSGVALHQEILDFYEWVRPQDFEREMRLELISRLQKTFSKLEPGCRIKPFGSFAAGLYLPTSDMDLVLMTSSLSGSRFPTNPKSLLFFISKLLDREGIAVPGSLHPIAGAKVPIIKFVDAITGLKVDICFNNETGVVANDTFHQWKSLYPAMPVLVSVIKQYLMIRGLNDVAFGGLGGFSTICLVTSLIQHHVPTGQTPNLGSLLLNFFYLYGNVFNKQEIAIRLEPPGYVRKDLYAPFAHNSDRPNRLAVIDPNRADNNISGGTAEIDLIFSCFSVAHRDLQGRLAKREQSGEASKSLLHDLLAGDYRTYETQRERLRQLYTDRFGPSTNSLPPVLSLCGPAGVALPNGTGAGREQSNLVQGVSNRINGRESLGEVDSSERQKPSKSQRRNLAAQERATRLRKLRPEIANIGSRLSLEEAVRLGGYENSDAMDKDLAKRARRLSL